jgi:PAS domain S-box-containing protein
MISSLPFIDSELTATKVVDHETVSGISLLDSLMETSPDYIYFKDRQSRFIRVNSAFAASHGLSRPEAAIGKTDHDLFTEPHASQAYADEHWIMETGGEIIGKEEAGEQPGGDTRWVSTTKVPHRNSKGEIIGIIGISRDITARKLAELEQERLQRQVIDLSRRAGMSEVAANVLHNVGNVLNSVNVSSSVLTEKVRDSRISSVVRTARLLKEHEADLGPFVTDNPQGKMLPEFLEKLSQRLVEEQSSVLEELELLTRNIDHIAQIIRVQQGYANVGGLQEFTDISLLVEDALQMSASMFMRHQIEMVRDFAPLPKMWVDKHKILQILINLVRNAKHALTDHGTAAKRLVVRVAEEGEDRLRISVSDNGIGINAENLNRIFEYGFTTKHDGHGFGLHGGAIAAREMGGSLTVSSEGHGLGATFTLELPINTRNSENPK